MSIELLLLLIFFILLPLLQQLLGGGREGDQRSPERGERQPVGRQPVRRPQPPPQAPQRPAISRRALSDAMIARERARAEAEAPTPVAPALKAYRSARRRTAVAGLHNPQSLRRAIVLMTILGPCRASRP